MTWMFLEAALTRLPGEGTRVPPMACVVSKGRAPSELFQGGCLSLSRLLPRLIFCGIQTDFD